MAKKQHTRQPSAIFGEKTMLFPVLFAAFLVLAVLAMGVRVLSDPFPRLEVAGHRISEEEYLRAMYQARSDVLSDHAAAGISLTDWSAETALGNPCQLVTDRALEILTEYYAIGNLAVERGYLTDAGYDAMRQDMEDINRQRQEALENGAIITGIPSFTPDDYISYRASSIRLQFCNDPNNPENRITAEEIRQRYEADRDKLYQQPDSLELAFVEIETATGELEQSLTALRQNALQTGDLAAALEEFSQLKGYFQEITVDSGTYGLYERAYGDVLSCAADLQTGDISQVFRQEGWLCLVQCLQRTVQQYRPLEDVESIVIQSIRESRYDALIEARMENTEVEGSLQALYRFTAEQLSND